MPGGVNDGAGALAKGAAAGAKKLVEQIKAKENDAKKIDSDKEKNELANALANTKNAEAKAVIQDEINIANSQVVIGGGSINGDNINGDNNKNTVIINNPPQPNPTPGPQPTPVPPKPTPKPKKKIGKGDVESGKSLAKQLHNQTNSVVANNSKVNDVFASVDADNAYSFFKEYSNLAKERPLDNPSTTGVMHDAHSLREIFTDVENKNTFPAVKALLTQARAAGVPEQHCTALEALMQDHAFDRGGDITADVGAKFDRAITNLLSVMDRYVTE